MAMTPPPRPTPLRDGDDPSGRAAPPTPDAARRRLLGAAVGLAPALALHPAFAQGSGAWPSRPVTILVPFPAGGGTDAFARPLFAALQKAAPGRAFVIDNKGGAGGTLGAGLAAKAAPDGHNFFMGGVHHAIAPSMYARLDYRMADDFVPVGLLASAPQVIVVNPQRIAARTLPELIALLRANPGKFNYGSAGNGTSHHLAGELFKQQTKTFVTHIPYRGAGPALQDLIAGQVDLMFDGLGSSAAHIRGGRIRAIAVAAPQRAPGFPDVPTAAEQGLPKYDVATWYGLWAPRGTPQPAIDAMTAALKQAFASEELKATWAGLGSLPPQHWGPALSTLTAQETQRWAAVVKAAGIVPD